MHTHLQMDISLSTDPSNDILLLEAAISEASGPVPVYIRYGRKDNYRILVLGIKNGSIDESLTNIKPIGYILIEDVIRPSAKETLNYLVKTNSYYNQKLPFNWNYYIDDNNGEITYFITAPKYFFEKNGLNALIHGLREITFNDEDYIYFQKYNPYKTEKVNRIYNYISDEDNEEEQ